MLVPAGIVHVICIVIITKRKNDCEIGAYLSRTPRLNRTEDSVLSAEQHLL